MSPNALLLALFVLALLFDFLNGFHDGANVVATIIASHAMSARGALALTALANLAGPFLLGVAVAQTMGTEVVRPQAITIAVLLAALASACLWDFVTWVCGIPVSSSHALLGGLLGAAVIEAGPEAIQSAGLWKIATALLVAPLLGLCAGLLVMLTTRWLLREASPKANLFLSRAQIVTATALALSHGANDAQKTMGVLALGLLILGFTPTFAIPWWLIALCTALGGSRLIRTLGVGLYRVRPIHGFSAQLASGMVILAASVAGGPVSSTQVVSMAIAGAGAAERRSKVRWGVLGDIVFAWVLTLPLCALLAVPLYLGIRAILQQGGG
jgi:PiT family inorganic phosphate transporter